MKSARDSKMNSSTKTKSGKTKKPRRVSAELQRSDLLDAASEMLAKGGPEALSVRKLATAVGTSTMAIYTAFEGKDGVIAALYEEAFARMAEFQEAVPRPDSPLEWLAGLGAAYRAFALKHPSYYALIMSQTRPISEMQSPNTEPLARGIARQRSYRSLSDAAEACQNGGLMSSGLSTEEITAVLWATVHGHVSLELAGFHENRKVADERFLLLTRSVLSGLLSLKGLQAWKTLVPA
jgi:AcrR family transcriptional regulator